MYLACFYTGGRLIKSNGDIPSYYCDTTMIGSFIGMGGCDDTRCNRVATRTYDHIIPIMINYRTADRPLMLLPRPIGALFRWPDRHLYTRYAAPGRVVCNNGCRRDSSLALPRLIPRRFYYYSALPPRHIYIRVDGFHVPTPARFLPRPETLKFNRPSVLACGRVLGLS